MPNKPSNRGRLLSLRNLLGLSLAILGILLLVVLSMPLWLGWALRTFAPEDLVAFESYETNGYGHFQLTNVSVTNPQATIQIDELNSLAPLNWYLSSGSEAEKDFLSIRNVTIELPPSPPEAEDGNPSSLPQDPQEALDLLESVLLKTDTWLPRATVEQVTLIQGERQLTLEALVWQKRSLSFNGTLSDFADYPFRTELTLNTNEPVLEFSVPKALFELKTSLKRQDPDLIATAILLFRENSAFLQTTFGPEAWAPVSATWNLDSWQLDLNSLGVNSVYSDLGFTLLGGWQDGQFENDLNGQLSPKLNNDDLPLPEVQFESALGGDLETLVVTQFSLDAPGIEARMNEEVEYRLTDMQLAGELSFDIDLDLGLLNYEDLEGQLTGFLTVTNNEGKPSGAFNLTGDGVKVATHAFEQLDIQATLTWPTLLIENTTARLTSGSNVNLSGTLDLESQTVAESKFSGTLQRETIAELLPETISLESIDFEAEALGPVNALSHQGSLSVEDLETEALHPLAATLSWDGQALQFDNLSLIAASETAELIVTAAGALSQSPMQWEVKTLDLQSEGAAFASLQSSTLLTVDPGDNLSIQYNELELLGPGGHLRSSGEISYPKSASVSLEVKNMEAQRWTRPWLKDPVPPVKIDSLSSEFGWDKSPLTLTTEFQATLPQDQRPIRASGKLSSDGNATRFEEVEIADNQGPWVTISGLVPVSFHPSTDSLVELDKNGDLDLAFTTSESQNWLNWLSSVSPFSLQRFNSQVSLDGSLSNLSGSFVIDLETEASTEEHGMPSTRIVTNGDIEKTILTVEGLQVTVEDEQFNVSGAIELPEQLLEKIETPAIEVPWQQTAFKLTIPPSKLTPIRYFAPQLLSTGGEIEANLEGSIENGIEGFFKMAGVNTRAIFPFGSLRDVTAELNFNDSRANLNNISANIGREPVLISGEVDYRQWTDPKYQISIVGENLPLVRKPGLLLRSDIDLSINNTASSETGITGTVLMKDGLFLLNRTNLMAGGAGGGKTAQTRPPFFSVEVPPIDNWDLDIEVKGDRFIRLKTPAADGALSIDMKLQGKLREPFATGRVEFDEGNLFFPFSSFRIDYGVVELPVGDPYAPIIEVIGTSRRFGYDITVEISGSAYDPQVYFSSSPPLSSEQIMLMVMAGENPEGMFDYSGTQRASKLGSYISKGLFGNSSSDSNFFSRISFESGENLSEQGKETMEIEYQLDDRFQLVGEYDEYDFWNAGLRWRIFQRKVVEADKEEAAQ